MLGPSGLSCKCKLKLTFVLSVTQFASPHFLPSSCSAADWRNGRKRHQLQLARKLNLSERHADTQCQLRIGAQGLRPGPIKKHWRTSNDRTQLVGRSSAENRRSPGAEVAQPGSNGAFFDRFVRVTLFANQGSVDTRRRFAARRCSSAATCNHQDKS